MMIDWKYWATVSVYLALRSTIFATASFMLVATPWLQFGLGSPLADPFFWLLTTLVGCTLFIVEFELSLVARAMQRGRREGRWLDRSNQRD